MKGMKDMLNKQSERTEFNDEEQRRYALKFSFKFWLILAERIIKGVLGQSHRVVILYAFD